MAIELCSYEYFLDKAGRDLQWAVGDLLEAYAKAPEFETKDALVGLAFMLLDADQRIRAFLRESLEPDDSPSASAVAQ